MAPSADLLRDPKAAWSPWRPTDSDPWDEGKAAHLHRRAGLGATWSQVRRDVAEGFEPSVRRVLDGESHGPDGRPAAEFAEIVQAMVASARREPNIERVQYLWLFRLIFTPHALAERMTLAWHSHYATSYDKVRNPLPMLDQNLALRELWRSTIAQLHLRMLRDPAMIIWLDGLGSRKSQTEREPRPRVPRDFRSRRGALHRDRRPRRRPCTDRLGGVALSARPDSLRRGRARRGRQDAFRPDRPVGHRGCRADRRCSSPRRPSTSPGDCFGRWSPTPSSPPPACSSRWPRRYAKTATWISHAGSS